jgi:hypothetical protein
MARKVKQFIEPTESEIAACAYLIFDHDGRVPGRELENWLQAEAQIIADRRHDAGLPCMPGTLHRNKQR